jgi:4-hydroxy-tetrahydrodipicolinate synthase
MFKGSIVALVTPMHTDGSIDKKAFIDLIEWHIDAKTDGLVIAGTTGESATLDTAEKQDIISLAIKQVAGRIPVIAGTGTNATHSTIKHTQAAAEAGADACLVVTPYYNKPTQNGLFQHYKAITENTSIPLILYNVPGRTACDLQPETAERLSALPTIIGIKEATGKVERTVEILKRCRQDFRVYSGDDATALDSLLQGAHGVISVTANVTPNKMHHLCEAALSGNKALAEKINEELMPLHKNLFLEANPIPTKWALHAMERIQPGIRLPLLPLDPQYHQTLKNALQQAGAI